MYFLEEWMKLMSRLEGFAAEGFLISAITLFLLLVLVTRHIRAYQGESGTLLTVNLNRLSIVLCLGSLVSYWLVLLWTPINFQTEYGFYSDDIIYTFRLCLVGFFISYFFFLVLDTNPHTYYTFEYYFIMVGAMLGLSIMCISSNFLNLLLSMELYSICIYYLINDKRASGRTHEAAFKYFVISSFSTAFYIFGVFWVYYGHGTMEYAALEIVSLNGGIIGAIGYFFIFFALLVKVGGGLFFFWIMDAYEGTSFPILMFLNLFVKPVFLLVVFKAVILSGSFTLFWIFQKLFFASAVVGVVGASLQSKIKRFLIFTSLYNMGFLSCFFWDPSYYMLNGFIVFFFVYSFNSYILMLLFGHLRDRSHRFLIVDLKDLSAVLPQNKNFAFALILFLLVISGLPPFSFFFVKYYLFFKFAHVGFGYVFVLLVASAFATFYYVRLIRVILEPRRPTFLFAPRHSSTVYSLVAVATVFNLYFVFFAEHAIEFLNSFVG